MRPAVRKSLWILAALLGLGAGLAFWLAPGWVATELQDQLVKRAARRGVALQIGHVYLEPLAALTLDGLVLRDAAHAESQPFARVPRVRIDWEVNGLLEPRIFLQHVTVESPELYAVRGADGHTNLEGVIQRLLAPVEDEEKKGGGRWRKYVSKHLPDLEVRHLRAGLDDAGEHSPATLAGVDLHHPRLTDASFKLHNASPVQEKAHLELTAEARVLGIEQPCLVNGTLDWPQKEGALTVQLPGGMSLQWHGYRASVGSVTARTDGLVALTSVKLAHDATSGTADSIASRFELDVREIDVTLSKLPGPAPELPEALRGRLPPQALKLLQHIAEVAIEEPVVIAQRQTAPSAAQGPDDDDDDPVEPQPDAGKAPGGKGDAKKPGLVKKPGEMVKPGAKEPAKDKKPEVGDGSVVREALAGVFGKGADRLEHQLSRLKTALAAIPVPVVSVHHGRARYKDESQGPASELSDFSGRVERKPGENLVAIQFDFHVPGRKDTNTVAGHVDVRTGDAEVKVRLDHLPIAPYAAVLPVAVTVEPTSAVEKAEVTLTYSAEKSRMGLEGHGTLAQVNLDVPRISRQRLLNLTVTASGRLDLDLKQQTLRLEGSELTVGKTHFLLDCAVQKFRTAPAFELHLKIPTVGCQDVVDSVPQGFAPMLEGMRCDGELSYAIDLVLDTARMDSMKLDFEPALQTVKITNTGKYIRFDIFDAPFEHHARQKDGTLYTFDTGPGTDRWAPYGTISQNFVKVLTTTEDGGFFGHRGFSLDSIKSAMVENLKRGRFVRGASTITQQLVKNLFFVEREKTISRKVQEAVITWQIERSLTKQQMLELYLNIIELGPKLYGIKAAAQHYFNRSPADLTLLQAIWLGSIVPNPRAFYHQFRDGHISESWQTYLCWIADIMLKREKITEDERKRLGACNVVFGGGPDGSETPPPDMGLGHEGDPALLDGAEPPPHDGRTAPSVPPDEQP
jgi:hypothetical protein